MGGGGGRSRVVVSRASVIEPAALGRPLQGPRRHLEVSPKSGCFFHLLLLLLLLLHLLLLLLLLPPPTIFLYIQFG